MLEADPPEGGKADCREAAVGVWAGGRTGSQVLQELGDAEERLAAVLGDQQGVRYGRGESSRLALGVFVWHFAVGTSFPLARSWLSRSRGAVLSISGFPSLL